MDPDKALDTASEEMKKPSAPSSTMEYQALGERWTPSDWSDSYDWMTFHSGNTGLKY